MNRAKFNPFDQTTWGDFDGSNIKYGYSVNSAPKIVSKPLSSLVPLSDIISRMAGLDIKALRLLLGSGLYASTGNRANIFLNTLDSAALHKTADYAPGIPSKQDVSDPSKLDVGKLYDWFLQEHTAKKAGQHYDLRIGSPETGLQSWAVRKGMPARGEKRLAVLQPLHEYSYGNWEGDIKEGYGAGKVTKADSGSVMITKASPKELSFVIANKRYPETFKMLRTDDKKWLLINTTPIDYQTLKKNPKPKYTSIDQNTAESLIDGSLAVSAKIDGASTLIEVLGDKINAVSYRPNTSGGPIDYSLKMGLAGIKPDPTLKGAVLRGEVYGERGGKAIPVQELSGILNSTLDKAIKTQQAKNINLKAAVFDVVKAPDGEDLSTYRKRLAVMRDIINKLPSNKFEIAPTEIDPDKAKKLLADIKSGKHPLTTEGIVLTKLDIPGAVPAKAKLIKEYDVLINKIFEAKTKGAARAGGFEYSRPGSDEIVGRVGTGFSHATLKDMLADPSKYVGRTARVSAQQEYPSGALRAPSFISLHEDI